MNHDQFAGSVSPFRRAGIRFSLLLLMLVVTAACLALAWWSRPKYVVAEAMFHVSSRPAVLIGESPFDQRENELFQKTQLTLIKSDFVLMAAARNLKAGTFPGAQSLSDTVNWILQNLAVEFPTGSEILVIRLRGTEEQANDLVQIVDAVAKAYEEEVIHRELNQRVRTKDVIALNASQLHDEIEEILLDQETTSAESIDDKVHRELNQMKLDVLVQLWRNVQKSLYIEEVNMDAPRRILLVQQAAIGPE